MTKFYINLLRLLAFVLAGLARSHTACLLLFGCRSVPFEREHNRVIWPIRGAFIAQLLIIVLYVAFTLPINITTFHWTFFPDSNWAWLRIEWEYAHALSAIIGGISFVLLRLDLVWAKWR